MKILIMMLFLIPCLCLAAVPTAQDVREYVKKIDAAIMESDTVLQTQNLNAVEAQSQRMRDLNDAGKQLGENIFSAPYGSCVKLGEQADELWQAQLSAGTAKNTVAFEGTLPRLRRAIENFKAVKRECLDAAKKNGQ